MQQKGKERLAAAAAAASDFEFCLADQFHN